MSSGGVNVLREVLALQATRGKRVRMNFLLKLINQLLPISPVRIYSFSSRYLVLAGNIERLNVWCVLPWEGVETGLTASAARCHHR